jgi:hypothetical protein
MQASARAQPATHWVLCEEVKLRHLATARKQRLDLLSAGAARHLGEKQLEQQQQRGSSNTQHTRQQGEVSVVQLCWMCNY